MASLLTIRLGALVAATACTLALAGCGGDDEPSAGATPGGTPTTASSAPTSASPTPTAKPKPQLPKCATLWVEGKALPSAFKGCVDEYGQVSKSLKGCFNRRLAQYGDQYYAIVGHEVIKALPDREHNKAYMDLLASCTG